ncbi:helix-turn-helix transcriptional regulator [Pseudomonas aeruginosa]
MPSTLSPDLGPRCMQAFTQVVPASLCVFYRIDEDCRAHDFQLLRMPAGMHRDYLRHYRDYDPLQPRHCLASASPVVPLRQGIARQPAEDSALYQGFLRRHGICDVVEVLAHAHQRPVAALSLLRDARLGAFSDQELRQLRALHGLMELAAQACATPTASAERLQGLTPREREIALLLRDGVSNKCLAQCLGLGLPTVKTHLLNLFRKTGAQPHRAGEATLPLAARGLGLRASSQKRNCRTASGLPLSCRPRRRSRWRLKEKPGNTQGRFNRYQARAPTSAKCNTSQPSPPATGGSSAASSWARAKPRFQCGASGGGAISPFSQRPPATIPESTRQGKSMQM